MHQRPLLPNNHPIQWKKIGQYLQRTLNTEVYLLDNKEYLYLLTDIQFSDVEKQKSSRLNLFWIRIGLEEYVGFISNKLDATKIEQMKKKIVNKTGFDAIAGMEDLKKLFEIEIIWPITNPEKYKTYKLSIPNGVLFFWPPGCGKTFISRKLAEEVSYNFYEISHSDLSSIYIHGTTWKIWEVFATAKENSPSIIFFDEISGLVPRRDNLSEHHQYREEEVNEFLIQLNDASKNNILVIWATNYPDRIDPAILRAGRMDKRIYIGPPDFNARKKLFEMYLKGRPLQNIDYHTLAEWTKGVTTIEQTAIGFNTWNYEEKFSERYVASDIQIMCDNCARKALAQNWPITMEICKSIISWFTPSVSQEDLNDYQKHIENYQRI